MGFLQRGDRPTPAEGAALIGAAARSRGALRGAGHSDARVPRGCQNAWCQEGPLLSQLLEDFSLL